MNERSWLVLLKHLVAYLQSLESFDSISVQGGTDGKRPEASKTIYVLRDTETDLDFHQRKNGSTNLWIECWVKNDSKNLMDAYEMIADVEQRFLDALTAWPQNLRTDLNLAAKITIPRFAGADERKRPLCGSYATIKIEWKR